jgi:hypothetical protein
VREPAVVLGRMELALVSTSRLTCFSGPHESFQFLYGFRSDLDASMAYQERELAQRGVVYPNRSGRVGSYVSKQCSEQPELIHLAGVLVGPVCGRHCARADSLRRHL